MSENVSPAVEPADEELVGLGLLGRTAWRAWAEDAPTALSLVPNPRQHFLSLERQTELEEDRIVSETVGPDQPGESSIQKAGRIREAQSQARETVIQEMLRPPEELRDPVEMLGLDRLELESQALHHSLLAFHLLPWVEEVPEPEDLEPEEWEIYQEAAPRKPLEAARRLGPNPSPARQWKTYQDYVDQTVELGWLADYYLGVIPSHEELVARAREYLGLTD